MARRTAWLSVLAALSILGAADAAAENTRSWKFDVSLDGRHIGEHRFTLRQSGELRELRSEARFAVRILFFEAYRYEHDAHEIWQGDCLQQLDAQTNDNGTRREVHGARSGDDFQVVTVDSTRQLARCVRSFAYWNPDVLLAANSLLNPQTGEYVSVHVERLGREAFGPEGRPAERLRLRAANPDAEKLRPIELWYTTDMEWLALESADAGRPAAALLAEVTHAHPGGGTDHDHFAWLWYCACADHDSGARRPRTLHGALVRDREHPDIAGA